MDAIWFVLIGFVFGQFSIIAAGYLGGLLRERSNDLS
jgi:hypothetical protein